MYVYTPNPPSPRDTIAHEIQDLLLDLVARREFVLFHWSHLRSRDAALELLHSRWRARPIADLLALRGPALIAVEAFFREVHSMWRWARDTEEMPASWEESFDRYARRVQRAGSWALANLGPDAPPQTPPTRLWPPPRRTP